MTGIGTRRLRRSRAWPVDMALCWRRRAGRLSRFDQDPEVAAFVQERPGRMPVVGIAEAALAEFGPERAPRKTAISRYWHRLDGERRTG